MSSRQISHPVFGIGSVLVDNGSTLVVRFASGIQEIEASSVTGLTGVHEAVAKGQVGNVEQLVARVQAAAITSLNDAWGVFSRSRISLLPHQLWVCHRALREWPVRLLIADDVGLGKTVEAGLILWPLLSRKVVQRVLVLTPASLVDQWQDRMRKMFDIRLSIYQPELDSGKRDFWNVHQQVVASLPTLRLDRDDRHERLLDAPDWDLVIVDEAHHLHADEASGKTQGFLLLEKLQKAGKIRSCVLFTATPHRGKDYGFWSLMSLVDGQAFGPGKPEQAMREKLHARLIRNCKQKVVDMQGNRLFQPILQFPEKFEYSPEEAEFYRLMTSFIMSGKAYASGLSSQGRGQVMLVLIALQKLASSSVAAVRGALRTRLTSIRDSARNLRQELEELGSEERDAAEEGALAQWIRSSHQSSMMLMENEIIHLERLLQAAEKVVAESRIQRILEIINERFAEKSVLLFTEYKATQALIVSALMHQFGENSVGFINGDERLNEVLCPDGKVRAIARRRGDMGDAFNAGDIRFLVSTEAGGEGIDLQAKCHCLIHVDLPWNPMRLHQRVGRVNRYGQRHQVQVVSIRNPDTIESRIWDKLEEKLANIMRDLGAAMDEPEDLLQLVLGMSNSKVFDEVFSDGVNAPRQGFDKWFDQKTQNFGGADAVNTVLSLVGHADGFDLSGLRNVPKVDLPDLEPFFLLLLRLNGRKVEVNEQGLTFLTPDSWRNSPKISRKYEHMLFLRAIEGKDAQSRIMGVGHPLVDQAIVEAKSFTVPFSILPGLANTLFIYEVFDRVTTGQGQVKRLLVGVALGGDEARLLLDAQILELMNRHCRHLPGKADASDLALNSDAVLQRCEAADKFVQRALGGLDLPFTVPGVECLAVMANGSER
ncbi:MAG: DEAD/DEAH box helicase [Chitinivorax sp.]